MGKVNVVFILDKFLSALLRLESKLFDNGIHFHFVPDFQGETIL
jgi:hypothetical protein